MGFIRTAIILVILLGAGQHFVHSAQEALAQRASDEVFVPCVQNGISAELAGGLSVEELATLKALLAVVTVEDGVVKLQDVNLQVVGDLPNTGNVIIGHNRPRGISPRDGQGVHRSGRNNLIIGNYHNWEGDYNLLAGGQHWAHGDYQAAIGGHMADLGADAAVSISGGVNDVKDGVIIGGRANTVYGRAIVIGGGFITGTNGTVTVFGIND